MGESVGPFNPVRTLCSGSSTWRVKVRVLRIWEKCPVGDPSRPFAMNLVLLDSEGTKIEATIRKVLIKKYKGEIAEGKVYRILFFDLVDNRGSYRGSSHEFQIQFNGRTKVFPDHSDTIPMNCFSFKNSQEIALTLGDCDDLVDVIGLVTAVSAEKQYSNAHGVTRLIVLELADDGGKVQCSLFGDYVDQVNKFMAVGGQDLPVVIIQFTKLKTFKGDVVIQNVLNATKILWNPDVAEANAFRDGLSLHGMNVEMPVGHIDDGHRTLPVADEFLTKFPRKSISNLETTMEEGVFIVLATIVGLPEMEKWWYPACRCHKAVITEDGSYYCPECASVILEVIPRFRVKADVSDGIGYATVVMFDADCNHLLKKTCREFVLRSKGSGSGGWYPQELMDLVGTELIFKIEKTDKQSSNNNFDDSYRVKKICDDVDVIAKFKDSNMLQTPSKFISSALSIKDPSSAMVAEFSASSGCSSEKLAEIEPSLGSIDTISVVEDSGVHSSNETGVTDDACSSRAAKKMKLKVYKKDK